MNVKKLFVAGLVAFAGLVNAHALITVSAPDLILGFKATSGTGNTSNLEINLGTAADLVTASGGSEITLSQVSVLDIESTYGSADAWKRSALQFAVVGTSGAAGGYNLWRTVGDGLTPNNPLASQTGISGNIGSLYSASAGGLAGGTATANSGGKAAVIGTAGSNSWSSKITTSNNFGGSSWNTPAIFGTTAALTSASYVALDLYSLVQAAASPVQVGEFRLYNDGHFTFAAAAIPEPSTYAAILGVATLGFAALRRRKQAQLVA